MTRPLTALALVGAAGISAIALADAASLALAGGAGAAGEERGVTPLLVLSAVVHAGAYLAFAAVLRAERARVDGGSRWRRLVRVVLTAALSVLAVSMLVGAVVSVATGEVSDDAVTGAVAGTAFLLMFAASLALGISLLRRPGMRLAAWTLTGILGGLVLTILLGVAGSPWAHPAYVEVLAAFGIAFVGLAPREREQALVREPTTASPEGAESLSS